MISSLLDLQESTISLLYLGLGIGLFVYGVGLWTDVISIQPPALLVFAISVVLLAYGLALVLRQ